MNQATSQSPEPPIQRTVSVLLQREVDDDRWGRPRWSILGVLPQAGEIPERPTRSLARDGDEARVYLWRGLILRLNPDACDDYWLNLESGRPLLFVICQSDPGGDLLPVTVSADQEDGVAAQEVDETVLQTAMPISIAAWVEQYVRTYWRPGPRKNKRKPNDKVGL